MADNKNSNEDWEGNLSLDERYRNGGGMQETDEPRVFDTVDEMNRAHRDPCVLWNQIADLKHWDDEWDYA